MTQKFNILSNNGFTQKNKLPTISVLSLILFMMLVPASSAFADPIIYFDSSSYTLDAFPITITVDDSSNPEFTNAESGTQKIIATLSTSAEQKTITLTETGDTDGIFTTVIALSYQDYEFNLGDTIQVNVIQPDIIIPGDPNTTQMTIGTFDVLAMSPKELNSEFILTETEPDTGQFVGTFTLVSDLTSGDKLKADPGDLVFVTPDNLIHNFGLVMPNPNDGFNMIKTAIPPSNGTVIFDTLTVSYQDVFAYADVEDLDGSGSGSGGVITRPGLVLNFIAALLGGGGTQSAPPTLGLDKNLNRIVDGGFSFNGNPVDVKQYYTPYPLIVTQVGDLNTIKLKIFENNGPDNIAHVGLSYGLGSGETFNEGRATIEFDRTFDGVETVTVFDPKDSLGAVNVTTAEINCNAKSQDKCLEVTFDHTFRESLEYNMVATNIWDFQRNGWQNYFNHGIHIEGESMNLPEQYSGIYQGHVYTLTETGKNTAVDNNGNSWTFDKTWNKDFIKPILADSDILNPDKMHAIERLGFDYSDGQEIFGFTRVDHGFADTKNKQQNIAQNIMKEMCAECQMKPFEKINDIFSYDIPNYSKMDKTKMNQEEQKAQEFLKQYFEKIYPGKVND